MSRSASKLAAVALSGVGAATLYRLVTTGALTLDVGIGRRSRPLGPLTVDINAPRDLVFDAIAAPYLGNPGRELAAHIEVLDRGSDMVVAAHRTPVAGGLVAMTVEAVGFRRPDEVTFHLLRGPVPHVRERFTLDDRDGVTTLSYDGELGTDLGVIGERWGDIVSRIWVRTVERSLDDLRERTERLAAARRRREASA